MIVLNSMHWKVHFWVHFDSISFQNDFWIFHNDSIFPENPKASKWKYVYAQILGKGTISLMSAHCYNILSQLINYSYSKADEMWCEKCTYRIETFCIKRFFQLFFSVFHLLYKLYFPKGLVWQIYHLTTILLQWEWIFFFFFTLVLLSCHEHVLLSRFCMWNRIIIDVTHDVSWQSSLFRRA